MTNRLEEDKISQTAQEESFAPEEEMQAEAWQDELPPEDDFHDTGEPLEEEPSEEEGSEEEVLSDEEEQDTAVLGDKKRGKAILLGVIAVGAALVGGMAYLQFSASGAGESSPRVSMPIASIVDAKNMKRVPSEEEAATSSLSPKTNEMDLAELYRAAQKQTPSDGALALPNDPQGHEEDKGKLGVSTDVVALSGTEAAPSPEKTTEVKHSSEAPAQQIAKIEDIPMPELQPEISAPSAKDVKASAEIKKEDAPLKRLPLALETTQKPESAKIEDSANKQMKLMAEQMEALKDSLNQTLARNEALEKRLEEMQKKEKEPEDSALRARVSQLEKELEATKGKAKKTARVVSPKPAKKKEAVAASSPPPRQESRAEIASEDGQRLVLRAATPEAAWVSKGSYSSALQQVQVGDTLPGIGKIKEIRQRGESWLIIGSFGVLR